MLKRGYAGTYHLMSAKQLHRYVNEFAGRHLQRPLNTADQMAGTARRLNGKRLDYATLTADAYPAPLPSRIAASRGSDADAQALARCARHSQLCCAGVRQA